MTTWVLLRGLGREARHWGGFVPALQAALGPAARVLAVDLPGTGGARSRPSPWSISGIADDVLGTLRDIGAEPPYVWVGMSLGGMVALTLAQRVPGHTQGCAVINTSVAALSPFWHRLRPHAAWRLLLAAMPWRSARSRERAILGLTSNSPIRTAILAQWTSCARDAPVARTTVFRQLRAAASSRAPVAPPVKVWLIACERDRIVSWECSRALARHWSLNLQVHPTAGHDLAVDDPEWLVATLVVLHQQTMLPDM